ncbi:MAG: signal peptidase I [Firmicutes bacterium]|nr:signal peptidase I [Bacillota bacterium]
MDEFEEIVEINIDTEAQNLENKKLMTKSFRKIISFIIFAFVIVILSIILQSKPLFIFNFSSSGDDTDTINQFFGIVSYVFMTGTLIYMCFFVYLYFQRKKNPIEKQLLTLNSFKKHYNAFDLLGVVPAFLVFVIIVNGFFFGFATVIGPSMQPTFNCGDYVIINHYDAEYSKDDIVILFEPDTSLKLIKRLVGLPGDTLLVSEEGVFINGVQIETYMDLPHPTYFTSTITIEEGYYYVLGDNRTNSTDSRIFGLVSFEDMIGIVVFRVASGACPVIT